MLVYIAQKEVNLVGFSECREKGRKITNARKRSYKYIDRYREKKNKRHRDRVRACSASPHVICLMSGRFTFLVRC